MKSFLFTLLLFVLMLCAVITNTLFIDRLTRDMLILIDQLPGSAGEDGMPHLDRLDARWEKARKWVGLSVSSSDINRISDELISLRAFCKYGGNGDYITAREELRLAIEDLREFEIPLANLFFDK